MRKKMSEETKKKISNTLKSKDGRTEEEKKNHKKQVIKDWHIKNNTPEKRKEYYKIKENLDKVISNNMLKDYGITLEDFNALLEKQNNSCNICKRHKSEFKRRLNIDHCHKTGKIRGLLCGGCNSGIGNLKDNPELILKSHEYLLYYQNTIMADLIKKIIIL